MTLYSTVSYKIEFFPILPMPEPDMLDFPISHSVNSINDFFFFCFDKATVHRMENGQNRLNTIVLGNSSPKQTSKLVPTKHSLNYFWNFCAMCQTSILLIIITFWQECLLHCCGSLIISSAQNEEKNCQYFSSFACLLVGWMAWWWL